MVLVPANLSRFGFSPCTFFVLFLVPAKYFFVVFSPSRDHFQKQNILQGPFLKSKDFARSIFLINEFSHHVPHVQIITKVGPGTKTKMRHLQGPKTTKKNLQGLKPKRDIFAGTKTIF